MQAFDVFNAALRVFIQRFRKVPAFGLLVLLAENGALLPHALVGRVGVQVQHVGLDRFLRGVERGDAVVAELRTLLFGFDALAAEVPLTE